MKTSLSIAVGANGMRCCPHRYLPTQRCKASQVKKRFTLHLLILGGAMFQSSPFVSYGALGRLVTVYGAHFSSPTRNIVHMNLNTPSTTMICGVQGAGKSHTVSVIIENSLIS